MSNDLMLQDEEPVSHNTSLVQVEQSRAIQEIQASLIIAKKFPRDLIQAETRIMAECDRIGLAKKATYSYPRGGETVSGPSIRLAEVLARAYGNLSYGSRVISQGVTESQVEAVCWDQETNVKATRIFTVKHEIGLKGGKVKKLTDERDIYEKIANSASRRTRACILQVIPGDIVEAAVKRCQQTIAKGGGKSRADVIKEMVMAFITLGVSQEMIEDRMGHKLDVMSNEELVEYTEIYNSIKDKATKRGEWFNFPDDDKDAATETADIREKLNANTKKSPKIPEKKEAAPGAFAKYSEGVEDL